MAFGLLLGMLHALTHSVVLLSEAVLFVSGMILLLRFPRTPVGVVPRRAAFISPLSDAETLIVGCILYVGIVLVWTIAVVPITDYDSLWYHLPIMSTWYQTSSLTIDEQWEQVSRYPFNWEVLCTLFVLPFDEDFLVASPNLIAWVLFGLSIYRPSVSTSRSGKCSNLFSKLHCFKTGV